MLCPGKSTEERQPPVVPLYDGSPYPARFHKYFAFASTAFGSNATEAVLLDEACHHLGRTTEYTKEPGLDYAILFCGFIIDVTKDIT